MGFLPGLSTLSDMFIGICATTNSGLANALNCNDFNCGDAEPVDVNITLPIINLATGEIWNSLSPVPANCVNAVSKEESFGLFNASNLFENCNSIDVSAGKLNVLISAPTNCFSSAVKKSAADVIMYPVV